MPYVRPNPLVITATGDTRMSGFVKLDANESYIVNGLNAEARRIDDLEDAVDSLTGTTQYQVAAGTSDIMLLSPLSAAWLRGHGECRLIKSGSDLKLERVGLGRMLVNGLMVQIPVAGLTLSTSGLSENTLYYIYLGKEDVDADSDGVVDGYTLSLAATASAPIIDANGIMVMAGDATKTLVGMARTVAGPAWADGERNRLVLSYFNRRVKGLYFPFDEEKTIKSADFSRVTADGTMLTFLSWGEDQPAFGLTASGNMVSTGAWGDLKLYVDGAGVDRCAIRSYGGYSTRPGNFSIPQQRVPATLGYHYVDLYGKAEETTYGFKLLLDPPCTLHGEIIG